MKFINWKILKESLSVDFLSHEADKLKSVKKLQPFYAIPDFETFSRPGEPEQQNILFTNDDLNTFTVNYTSKGKIFSIDFWKDKNSPIVTYYVKNGDTSSIAKMIPHIIDKPEKGITVDIKRASSKVLQEDNIFEEEADLEMRKPKPDTSHDPEVEKIERESDDNYDFADPETIFEDLKTYVKMVIDGVQPSLIITGSPGVGKTYEVTNQLKTTGLTKGKDFVHVKGRSTAAGMFITLFENNDKIIVFDDCDSIFKNEDAVNILGGALDSYDEREISWLVGRPLKLPSGESVPKTFVFTGKVIFISNLPQRKIADKLKSRSFVLEVALTDADMLSKMRKELKNVSPNVSMVYKVEALDLIEEAAEDAKNLELNMRTLIKAIKILGAIDNLSLAKRLIIQQCSYK